MLLWLLIILLLVGGLAVVLKGDAGTIAGLDAGSFIAIMTVAALLLFVGSSLATSYRGRLGSAIKDLAMWIGLALALVAGYSFREEFAFFYRRVAGELLPPGESMVVESTRPGETAVRIRRRPDGHFVARTQINGVNVAMLVDTGASTVVLRPADARQIGINPDSLTYSIPVQTANGTAYAASVRLRRLAIGSITLDGVEALVTKPGALSQSLLGMNFLRRLRSYEFQGEFLTLRG